MDGLGFQLHFQSPVREASSAQRLRSVLQRVFLRFVCRYAVNMTWISVIQYHSSVSDIGKTIDGTGHIHTPRTKGSYDTSDCFAIYDAKNVRSVKRFGSWSCYEGRAAATPATQDTALGDRFDQTKKAS